MTQHVNETAMHCNSNHWALHGKNPMVTHPSTMLAAYAVVGC